jgi:hypothetical protein
MLVKINARGQGGGAGATQYLTGDFGTIPTENGKSRMPNKAEQANRIGLRKVKPVVLRGDVQQTRELIDSLSFSRNYTSGTLSFKENNISDEQKNKIMDEYQRMLLAGLDRDQYDILWIEHRDKDRLELNFLIPNVELGTGKRLQPYYDKVDRERVNAWQQTVNDKYGFSDPHDPARKSALTTAHNLPKDKKLAVQTITDSISMLIAQGAITNRNGVINELEVKGFEIARKTPSAISIKDPDGGRNIRLKGEYYEQAFTSLEAVRGTNEKRDRDYQEQRKQRLESSRITLSKAYKAKCKYNKERYPRAKRTEPTSNTASNIQSLASINTGNDIRRKPNNIGIVHNAEIKHPTINKVVSNNVRHKSRISTCIETVVNAVRTAVQRSISANTRTGRADYIANELNNAKFKQHKQRKQRQDPSFSRRFGM